MANARAWLTAPFKMLRNLNRKTVKMSPAEFQADLKAYLDKELERSQCTMHAGYLYIPLPQPFGSYIDYRWDGTGLQNLYGGLGQLGAQQADAQYAQHMLNLMRERR